MRHDGRGAGLPIRKSRGTAIVLAAGALLWLCACLSGEPARKIAGGTGSEAGDAYGVAWSVLGERSSAGARVSLYVNNDTTFAHPTLDIVTTADAQGKFHLTVKRAGIYDLEILAAGEDAILYKKDIRIEVPGETDLGRLSLPASATYRAKLVAPPLGPARIWLDGTPYSAAVDSLGSFAFARLPAGTYRVFSERSTGDSLVRVDLGSLTLDPGDSIAPPVIDTAHGDTLILDPRPADSVPNVVQRSEVLIEDFTDGGEVSAYGMVNGGGRWTAAAEGTMPIFPTTGSFDDASNTAGGYKGRSLLVSYGEPSNAYGKAIVQMEMGSDTLVGLRPDTLVFWTKGTGILQADVLVWTALGGGSTGIRSGTFSINLTAQWREIRVPLKPGLATVAAGGPGYIRFSGSGGAGYGIDEIRMVGEK